MKPEPSVFDTSDKEADELAMLEGEADADAGRITPHAQVSEWLSRWGTPEETPMPTEWLKK